MFPPRRALNCCRPTTALCVKGVDQLRRRLEEEEAIYGAVLTFKSYGHTLTMMSYLCYLGRNIRVMEYEWPEVVRKIWKEKRTWAHLLRILGW